MIFTKEQYDYMGKLYLDDLPFNSSDEWLMLELFNHLPDHIQGLAVSWGMDDTVFKDDVFEYLVENQFGMTTKEYQKELYPKLGDTILRIDFDKLKAEL